MGLSDANRHHFGNLPKNPLFAPFYHLQKLCSSLGLINSSVNRLNLLNHRHPSDWKSTHSMVCCGSFSYNKKFGRSQFMTKNATVDFQWKANLLTFFPIFFQLVIKDWSARAPNSHIDGGMTYSDGKLTVPIAGRYYIYAQFYYHESGRIFSRVNDKFITMLQPAVGSGSRHGALYSGGVFKLNAGDVITVLATNAHGTVRGYMGPFHSYFGAFLIWSHESCHRSKSFFLFFLLISC